MKRKSNAYRRVVAVRKWSNAAHAYQHSTVTVDLEIDWHGLYTELGNKAFTNRSKRTRVMGGLIKAKLV